MKKLFVGVIGQGIIKQKELYYTAYKIGSFIAKHGFILVCGGLGGVMEAASKGAFDNNGIVIGILPGTNKKDANHYVTCPIATNMGHARNIIIAHTADILFAVGGEMGTLSEIAISLKLKKPVLGIKTHKIKGVISFNNADDAIDYFISHHISD